MLIIFPCDPLKPDNVDPHFAKEAEVAQTWGHDTSVVSWENIVADKGITAIERVPEFEEETLALYRGWMLTVEQYERLYESLETHSVSLLTNPDQYRNAHHLPEWYEDLADDTFESVWVPKEEIKGLDSLVEIASEMAPCVIKDYVKSRKHEWGEACFIPDAKSAESVIQTFLKRQDDLQGGVVFRKFVPLKSIGKHPESGMPMAEEFRIFWIKGEVAGVGEYWDPEYYEGEDLPVPNPVEGGPETYRFPYALEDLPGPDILGALVRKIDNPFITMDVARTEDGEWVVVEIGDGQVSDLPHDVTGGEVLYNRLRHWVDPPPQPPLLTQAQLDRMSCAHEDCDHKGHGTQFFFHARCHMDAPTWVVYEGGALTILCAECRRPVARVLVDPGDVVRH